MSEVRGAVPVRRGGHLGDDLVDRDRQMTLRDDDLRAFLKAVDDTLAMIRCADPTELPEALERLEATARRIGR